MRIDLDETALKQWIEDSINDGRHILAAGYQGKTLLYESNNQKLVIKVPHGQGIARYIHRHMLRHEYDVYLKLNGFEGAPTCYGLIDNQYLVLEYIEGSSIRDKRPVNEENYLNALLEYIKSIHRMNVAHMDLKRKDNLYVREDDSPCLLDFGTAVIKRPGFHPFNHYRYRLARQFDYNAWIKHKYHGSYEEMNTVDKQLYKSTWIETIARKIKRAFRNI